MNSYFISGMCIFDNGQKNYFYRGFDMDESVSGIDALIHKVREIETSEFNFYEGFHGTVIVTAFNRV